MNDKEKKAIEFIKNELKDEKIRKDYKSLSGLYGNLEIEILLNLIEKQKEKIEHLKFYIKEIEIYKRNLFETYEKQEKEIKEWADIADDILRATDKYGEISIGEIPNYIIELQQEKEKNKKLEEKAKTTIEVVRANYIHKDKIKTKIKEYEALDQEFTKPGNFDLEIGVLKELLEEGE